MPEVTNILITILTGLAVVIGLVALVYMLTIVFDKYCCCFQRGEIYVLTAEELMERQHASDLTKRSGLAGILPEERVRIYIHFFSQRALTYVPDGDREKEKGNIESLEVINSKTDSNATGPQSQPPEDHELEDLCMMEHREEQCPICLSEYMEGDKIISGTSCSHRFHLQCCMQWLEKNDHCAYCRKDMMTPSEMAKAAREELGEARVKKITYINEMAAKRLAEYEAALAAGADNTEVSRQFATGTMPGDQQRLLDESGNSLEANNNTTNIQSSSAPANTEETA
jgi:hypothetical protein